VALVSSPDAGSVNMERGLLAELETTRGHFDTPCARARNASCEGSDNQTALGEVARVMPSIGWVVAASATGSSSAQLDSVFRRHFNAYGSRKISLRLIP
jgi:hypothetical protein